MCSKSISSILAGLVFILTGCGSDSSSRSSSNISLGGAYQGRWKGSCEVLSTVSSREATVSINGDGTLQLQFALHANNSCSLLVSTEIASGTFILGGSNINVKDANDITFDLKSSAVTIEATAVSTFNSGNICGMNTWAAGVPKILPLPNSCTSVAFVKGSTLVGIVNGQLYFGNSTSTALDMAESYVKQ